MLVLVAVAPSFSVLATAIFTLGLVGIAVQLLIPFAAHLAPPEDRGRVVGTALGGMLGGILLSRTVSGVIGQSLGWRAMYWIAAALTVGMLLTLLALPKYQPSARLSYWELLRSTVDLVWEEPVLRQSCVFGAATFGAYSAFWATLAFHLAEPPFTYGSEVAGVFGLLGVFGAVAAPLVGRAGDRGNVRRTVGLGIGVIALSFVLLVLGGNVLWVLVAGAALLDLGVQVVHISNQTRNYALRLAARNRLNTVYMVAYFAGGMVGSSLGATGWAVAGWVGVCAVGVFLPIMAFGAYLLSCTRRSSSPHLAELLREAEEIR
jgi:predicted MFS family arabinose efflux permease